MTNLAQVKMPDNKSEHRRGLKQFLFPFLLQLYAAFLEQLDLYTC